MADSNQPTIPEVLQSPAHVSTPPPAKGFKAVVKHVRDWMEAYFWLPIALFSIVLAAKFVYFLTGRQPTENADFVIDMAGRFVAAILVIFLLSVTKEQTSFWLSKEEALANPKSHAIQAATKVVFAVIFTYLLTH